MSSPTHPFSSPGPSGGNDRPASAHEGRGVRIAASESSVDPLPGVWDLSRGRARPDGWRWLTRFLIVSLTVMTMGLGAATILTSLLLRPGPSVQPISVIIPSGTAVAGIGAMLSEHGVIAGGFSFRLGVRFLTDNGPLQAGEFIFPAGASTLTAIRILQDAAPVAHPLTIPEGSTNAQILNIMGAIDGLAGSPSPLLYEGQLLPETYHFTLGDTADDVIGRMRAAMDETLAALWPGRADNLPFTLPEEAIILASIVERETGLTGERPLVAAVFVNRLRVGMRLQADPTVAYAVSGGQGLERTLTLEDLAFDSPYNTYIYAGLPPGPIANPGRAAIEAVLNPASSTALYFVANGNGGHAFADTLAEHNANVARYRASLR